MYKVFILIIITSLFSNYVLAQDISYTKFNESNIKYKHKHIHNALNELQINTWNNINRDSIKEFIIGYAALIKLYSDSYELDSCSSPENCKLLAYFQLFTDEALTEKDKEIPFSKLYNIWFTKMFSIICPDYSESNKMVSFTDLKFKVWTSKIKFNLSMINFDKNSTRVGFNLDIVAISLHFEISRLQNLYPNIEPIVPKVTYNKNAHSYLVYFELENSLTHDILKEIVIPISMNKPRAFKENNYWVVHWESLDSPQVYSYLNGALKEKKSIIQFKTPSKEHSDEFIKALVRLTENIQEANKYYYYKFVLPNKK